MSLRPFSPVTEPDHICWLLKAVSLRLTHSTAGSRWVFGVRFPDEGPPFVFAAYDWAMPENPGCPNCNESAIPVLVGMPAWPMMEVAEEGPIRGWSFWRSEQLKKA